jgi:hypothetical protein
VNNPFKIDMDLQQLYILQKAHSNNGGICIPTEIPELKGLDLRVSDLIEKGYLTRRVMYRPNGQHFIYEITDSGKLRVCKHDGDPHVYNEAIRISRQHNLTLKQKLSAIQKDRQIYTVNVDHLYIYYSIEACLEYEINTAYTF